MLDGESPVADLSAALQLAQEWVTSSCTSAGGVNIARPDSWHLIGMTNQWFCDVMWGLLDWQLSAFKAKTKQRHT